MNHICYIYHSETGHTRGIADRCLASTGGERIEVRDLQNYNRVTKYMVGARRAMKELLDPIEPSKIDVSSYNLIVIGSPVWGGKSTPAINAAIKALEGCEGKKCVLYVTCGGSPGESLSQMEDNLKRKGVNVSASMSFTHREFRGEAKVNNLIEQIKAAAT